MKNLILILLVIMSSCSSDEPNQQINIEAGTGFYVVNELGEDLLNPNHSNSIDFDKIKIYYLINGKEVDAYNANSDAPKGISLESPNDKYSKYHLNLGFNIEENDEITYTIVQWDEQNRDIFEVQFNKGEGYLLAVKCWVDKKLVWNVNNGDERFFTLEK